MTQCPGLSSMNWLSGGGDMGLLIRTMDWTSNPLGPLDQWPQSLRTAVSLCLSSTFPISIVWGPEMIQLYNDAYRPICGAGHPESMGQRFWTTWESARPAVGAVIEKAASGEGSYLENQRMFLERNGYLEEAFMTFSFSPIRDEEGKVGGLFHPITETTERMLNARRTQIVRDLAVQLGEAKKLQDIFETTCRLHKSMELDIPFIIFYEKEGASFTAKTQAGIAAHFIKNLPHPEVVHSPSLVALDPIDPGLEAGPYPEPPHTAMLLPIQFQALEGPVALALAGISSRRALDDDYRNFYEALSNALNTAYSSVYALELEQRRARELAELDRAKTAFFNNISHELRTPLTLMLAPLEDRLSALDPGLPEYRSTELIFRNGQRLLKLVNGLLDFSRIEAGRMAARFSPIPLFSYTQELAHVFRELIERGGLAFSIEGQEFSESIYVDPEMWERIVLNLLSNAVKYTLHGRIRILFEETPETVRICFKDTGIGIPAAEMPKLFERFHRVTDAKGRTFEGTGIGLSLIQELVRMHGGQIWAESQEHVGSVFTVELKKGKGHLDPQYVTGQVRASASRTSDLYFQEMEGWLDIALAASAPPLPKLEGHARVLVVDDNSDMRNYIQSLLLPYWEVRLARDGAEALTLLQSQTIDLIISDVMMPVMNGFELLQNIRTHSLLRAIPFIMLSARAGEEAKVEGFEAGADDYLVKPFTARELVARVAAALQTSRTRMEVNKILRERDRRMLAAFEHVSVGLVLISRDFRVVDSNPAFCELSGFDPEDLLGMPIRERDHQDHQSENARLFHALEQGEIPAFTQEKRLVKKSGEIVWVQSSVSPLYDSGGGIEYFVAVVQDINARKAAETHAEASQRAAEAANETKSLFLANVSHEVRTPLGVIQGFTQLLLDEAEPQGETTQWLGIIQRNALQLGALIDDVLDLSKVEADQMKLVEQHFSLSALLQGLEENFKPHAQRKGLEFSIEKKSWVPDLVYSDEMRVRQILTNVIGNAIKFTSTGRVKVIYQLLEETDGQRFLKFSICDTGMGVAENDKDRLFQAFSQADASISKNFGGTGLGLSLSRKLARLLDGDLSLESSSPGTGSVFAFVLKWKESDLDSTEPHEERSLENIFQSGNTRILIVDDSFDNRLLISRILISMKAMHIETASDGNEGIRLALEKGFDLIFMDVQMPVIDGFEAIQKLRQHGYHGRIVAFTAHAMQGYREKCLAAGFDDYLSKPISREKLVKSLEPLLKSPSLQNPRHRQQSDDDAHDRFAGDEAR